MSDFGDVEAIVATLPEVIEGTSYGRRAWKVANKAFAWERPFTKADIRRWGGSPRPEGPILGISTEDLHDKEGVLAAHPDSCFTIQHLDGYPAVLVDLDRTSVEALRELVVDSYLVHAPQTLSAMVLAAEEQG